MSALITAGTDGSTGNSAVTEKTQVIASGVFTGGVIAQIEVESDSLRKAVVYNFNKPDGISIDAKTGTTITATIKGGDAIASVDVSLL